MTITNTKTTYLTPASKHGAAKKWLQRQLRKGKSRQNLGNEEKEPDIPKASSTKDVAVQPPKTDVPELDAATKKSSLPDTNARDFCTLAPPPPHLPQTDPGVVRNVNAWLDASVRTSSPPLMGGLTYWRAATAPGAKDSASRQHAIPIIREPKASVSSFPQGQHVKSIRRRAKKMHVQMPSLLRTKSQRLTGRKQAHRQPASMPLLAVSYEAAKEGAPPIFMTRCRSVLRPAARPSTANASMQSKGVQSACQDSLEGRCVRHGHSLCSSRLDATSGSIEQQINAVPRSTRRGDSTRSPTVATSLTREDSMGNLSDAPTYFTGLPPPSYQSRTASILTISSFGCIDGMNAEQRQMSQQRAARERGVRGRLRRFAENFST